MGQMGALMSDHAGLYDADGLLKPHPETIALARATDDHAAVCTAGCKTSRFLACRVGVILALKSTIRMLEHARDHATVESLNATLKNPSLSAGDLRKYQIRMAAEVEKHSGHLAALERVPQGAEDPDRAP